MPELDPEHARVCADLFGWVRDAIAVAQETEVDDQALALLREVAPIAAEAERLLRLEIE